MSQNRFGFFNFIRAKSAVMLLTLLIPFVSSAFEIEGFIKDNNGDPVANKNVSVRVNLIQKASDPTDPSSFCTVYSEVQSSVTTDGLGGFVVRVGSGSIDFPSGSPAPSPYDFFDSAVPMACVANGPAPARSDLQLYLQFTVPTAGGTESVNLGPSDLASIPLAEKAKVARKIGSHTEGSLVRVEDGAGSPVEKSALTSDQFDSLLSWSAEAPSNFLKESALVSALGSALGYTPEAPLGYTPVNRNGDTMSGSLKVPEICDEAGANCISISAANSTTDGYLTSTDWITFNTVTKKVSSILSDSYLSVTGGTTPSISVNVGTSAGTVAAGNDSRIIGALQRSGGTMTGAIDMGGFDISSVGNFSLSNEKFLKLGSYAGDPNTVGWGVSEKGRAWFDTSSNQVKYWDGSDIKTLGLAGAGLTNFNGSAVSSHSLSVGTASASPAWSTNTGTGAHTLNIPMASTAGVTAGLISKTDYDNFIGKLSSVTGSALNSAMFWLGSGSNQATPVSMSGDVSINNLGATKIEKINNTTVSGVGLAQDNLLQNNSGSSLSGNSVLVTNGTATGVTAVTAQGDSVLVTNGSGVPGWSLVSNDNFSQYARLGGRSGNQTLIGSLDASGDLFLESTAHSTRGDVILNSSGGNVGVGTPTPGFSVDVFSASTAGLRVRSNNGSANFVLESKDYSPVVAGYRNKTSGSPILDEWLLSVMGGGYESGALKSEQVRMTFDADGDWNASSYPTRITFATTSVGSSGAPMERMRITNDGRVGIGTTTPQAALDVVGGVRVGTAPSTCNSATAGTFGYNDHLKVMEYCNGEIWKGTSGVTRCPANWTLIGSAGSGNAFCIQNTVAGTTNFDSAISNCRNLSALDSSLAAYGSTSLCTPGEWRHACLQIALTYGTSVSGAEWNYDYRDANSAMTAYIDGSACSSTIEAMTDSRAYRCCLK